MFNVVIHTQAHMHTPIHIVRVSVCLTRWMRNLNGYSIFDKQLI